MVDARLPSVAAAGDRMRRSIPRWGDVDVVAAAAPIDVAAPIASRPPVAERPTGAEGKPYREQAVADVRWRRPVIGRVVRIWPGAVDHCGIVIGHVNRVRVRWRNGNDLPASRLAYRDGLLFRRLKLVVCLRFCAQALDGVHHVGLLIDNRITKP